MKKINVLVRGASGLLAQRLIATLKLLPEVTIVGIYKNDPTLEKIIQIWSIVKNGIPDNLYLDGNSHLAHEVSKKTGYLFMPISEFNISSIDIVVDTTPMLDKFSEYQHYKKPILMQDGVFPKGRLISLPLIEKQDTGNGDPRFRQGGCILSGIIPILHVLNSHMKGAQLKITMQEDSRDNDYLISERLTNIRYDTSICKQVDLELKTFFPEAQISVLPVTKIPGLINYQVDFQVTLENVFTKEFFIKFFEDSGMKRVQILNDGISSLYPLNLARGLPRADSISPIHIFSSSFQKSESEIMFTASLYHRTLPILANLDSIFHLAYGLSPLDAIAKTDALMGF